MKDPIKFRRKIPFFHDKTESEFCTDPYERYHEMVLRQTAIHLADEFWGAYPFQSILDFICSQIPPKTGLKIAEIGCGVGRMIGELAIQNPKNQYHGIDFSYQMLKQANTFWVEEKTIELDWSDHGFDSVILAGHTLANLHFGLAKVENLPFENNSLDVLFSSFLIDRLEDPLKGFQEMSRVLKTGGTLIFVSPLNFQKKQHWEMFFPLKKLQRQLQIIGFQIDLIKKDWLVFEPLDKNGNKIQWNCIGMKIIRQF